MGQKRGVRFGAVVLAAMLAAGCGRALGPERFETTTLRGRVLLDGRPHYVGWLEILPVDGTRGLLRSAEIAADGSFEATRVPVGSVAARLAGRSPRRTGDAFLDEFLMNAHYGPAIRFKLPSGPSTSMDIELRDEAVKFARRIAQMRPKTP